MASDSVLDALAVTAEVCGAREFSRGAAAAMIAELRFYPEAAVLKSLNRCRRELRSLTLVDIISRIDDGHPGAEEAWAMLPKGESETIVWTPEIAEAYLVSRNLADPIAARMTFKEVYTKLLAEARADRKPAQWDVSFGFDPSLREGAIRAAAEKGRISQDDVQKLLPQISTANDLLAIEGPSEPMRDVSGFIADIKRRLTLVEPEGEPVNEYQEAKKCAADQMRRLKESEDEGK